VPGINISGLIFDAGPTQSGAAVSRSNGGPGDMVSAS
jgi:hypothetical protein